MAVIGDKAGLWSLKIDISEASEDSEIKAAGLFVEFRGMRKDEYAKYKQIQAETGVNVDTGIIVEYEDDKGREHQRKISPEAIVKRNAFLDQLIGKCIIDHNLETAPDKKRSAEDVWKWIGDRPDLYDFVVNTWISKHPFYKEKSGNDKI